MSSRGSVWTGVKTQMWDCRSRTWWCFWSSARLRLHWGVSLERRDTRPVFFREQCNRNLSIWWKMLQSTGRSVTHTHIKADIIKWFFFNLAKTCWGFFFDNHFGFEKFAILQLPQNLSQVSVFAESLDCVHLWSAMIARDGFIQLFQSGTDTATCSIFRYRYQSDTFFSPPAWQGLLLQRWQCSCLRHVVQS